MNFILRAPDGSWRRRFDLCYPGYRLIVEYDGRKHAFDQQWSGELTRREELDELEWRIIVVESAGSTGPAGLLRVRTALQSRGVRVPKTFKLKRTRHFAMPV